MHDGYPSVAPSISRDTLVRLDRHGWSPSQVRDCMDMLDDTGLRLLAIFGDPRCAARIDGEWVIVIADLVVPADPLRRLYRASGDDGVGRGCWIDRVLADALLLAATKGPLTTDRIASMAGKLAPAVWEGLGSRAMARDRIALEVDHLVGRGLLAAAPNAASTPKWTLTTSGSARVVGVVRTRWGTVARVPARGDGPSEVRRDRC